MTWFKVDDGFWSHPKTATLSDSAVALWVRAGAYSCQHLTDGLILRPVLRLLGTVNAAEELATSGLWITRDDGWLFHDWGDYQPTKADIEAERAAARERMRQRRRERKGRFAGSSPEQTAHVPGKFENGSSTPTRPDPTRPDLLSNSSNEESLRGARAPSPFCGKHQPDGSGGKACRACGDARMAYTLNPPKGVNTPIPFTVIPGAVCAEGKHKLVSDGTCSLCEYREAS